MQGSTFRSAALAVASLGLLAACDRGDTLTAPAGQALSSRAKLALEVSEYSAASGTRVSVSLANTSLATLGGVQGRLRFNPSQLRYVGQLRDAGSDQILLVNARAANAGELTVAVVEASGIEHSQPLVFDVISSAYATSLSFEPTDAVLNGDQVQQTTVTMDNAVQRNTALRTSGEATRLTVSDWTEVTAQIPDPGEVRAGLKFGDTNFDGALSLNDALYVINVSVGANEMLIGTDGTGGTGDRDAVVAGNVFPANGPGLGEVGDALPPGVEANGTRVLSLGDGLAIINESVGNNQDVVGEVIPGRPLVAVSNRVVVTGSINTNTTWTKSNIYELVDEVIVTGGATLTIEAGTLVEGRQGSQVGGVSTDGSALYIARDGMINAVGTPLEPIVFTCVGAKFKGCWGGVSILGNASTNDGPNSLSPIVAGRDAIGGCKQKSSEGRTTKFYGGCNDDDNSGVLQYARIEYAGFKFTATNELNGLALYGVGRGTTLDHIQVHAGLDDGIEFFGGTVNAKYLYLTANSDDSFDYTESFTGNAQFVIVQHDSLDSDKGLEMDNNTATPDALPRSAPKLYNFTVVGKQFTTSTAGAAGNNSVGGLHARLGAQPKMFNFIVQNFPFAIDIDNTQTCTGFNTASGMQIGNSMFTQNTRVDQSDTETYDCGADEVAALNAAGTNEFPATSPVLSPFSVTVPDFRPAFGTAAGGIAPPATPVGAPAGFFDVTATYKGAVKPSSASKNDIPWYSGWTRGWATAATP